MVHFKNKLILSGMLIYTAYMANRSLEKNCLFFFIIIIFIRQLSWRCSHSILSISFKPTGFIPLYNSWAIPDLCKHSNPVSGDTKWKEVLLTVVEISVTYLLNNDFNTNCCFLSTINAFSFIHLLHLFIPAIWVK